MFNLEFFAWLVRERKLSDRTAFDYTRRIMNFIRKNGYKDFWHLADDVFSVLHNDDGKLGRDRAALIKLNEYLFEIEYKRNFIFDVEVQNGKVVSVKLRTPHGIKDLTAEYQSGDFDIIKTLTVDKYETDTTPLVVKDPDPNRTECTPSEIYGTIEISKRTLEYWRDSNKGPKWRKHGGRYYYNIEELNKFIAQNFPRKIYKARIQ